MIDDDHDDREIFEAAIHKIDGVCCLTANSCSDALWKLALQENLVPDFIFIDLHMPRVDGRECLAKIRRIRRFKNVPVVMYSTSIAEQDIEEARRLGATAYISKPCSITQLEITLKDFFSQYPLNHNGL